MRCSVSDDSKYQLSDDDWQWVARMVDSLGPLTDRQRDILALRTAGLSPCIAEFGHNFNPERRLRRRWPGVSVGSALGGPLPHAGPHSARRTD